MISRGVLLFVLLAALTLAGCTPFRLSAVELGINGGVKRIESGGETYAREPSGHWEQEGQWFSGGDLRFIFTR